MVDEEEGGNLITIMHASKIITINACKQDVHNNHEKLLQAKQARGRVCEAKCYRTAKQARHGMHGVGDGCDDFGFQSRYLTTA